MSEERAAIGPYKILRKLGEGGMGAVYEAVHEAIERRVAIKFLHAEYAHDADITKRFFNEARAVNRIEHPSLVQISDYGQMPDGTAYIVMEYLSGETLSKRLSRSGGRIPLQESLQIAWQSAAALTAVHDKGIVHRDLKPENIMLVADPLIPSGERVKLLDFGIAKLMADVRGTKRGTRSDVIMGTPTYMSPEQCRGAGVVDAKTDVYALGVVLYEMLAGTPPFLSEGIGELIGMHLFREPKPLQEITTNIPAPVVALVHRLLIKERDGRPTMRQLAVELDQQRKRYVAEPLQTVADIPKPPDDRAPTQYLQLPAVLKPPAPHLSAVPEPPTPELPAVLEFPAPQLPAVLELPAPQLPALLEASAPQLPAVLERPAAPSSPVHANRQRPLIMTVTLGVVTLALAGGLFIRSARNPSPVRTARVTPPSLVTPPAKKPAPSTGVPSNIEAFSQPPPVQLKAENPPKITPVISPPQSANSSETPVKSVHENSNFLAQKIDRTQIKGQKKTILAKKSEVDKAETVPTKPVDNLPSSTPPASQTADIVALANKSGKPDENQNLKVSEPTNEIGKLEQAQRLYTQKNYFDAMQLAMRSENPRSVESLILIGKAACALHATDIAANKLNELKDRPADRMLIIEKCSEEGFKYSKGEFSPN